MTFMEHLEELRWTLIRSVIAIVVCMLAAFLAKDFVFDTIVLAPKNASFITYRAMCALGYKVGLDDGMCVGDLKFTLQTSESGQFSPILCLVRGGFNCFPILLWQVWRFLSPVCIPRKKLVARGVIFASFLSCGVASVLHPGT